MVGIDDFDLDPNEKYSASEVRETFGKSRAGRGIETLYHDDGERYIRLFSSPDSEYGDDLNSDPMRYVGEKNFDDPNGDQVPNRGNGALIESQTTKEPVFLFEKVSENPVQYFYYGQVEVVDYELTYRPSKGKREFDFYLKRAADRETSTAVDTEFDPEDELAPGKLREVDPDYRESPSEEETVSYESKKERQVEKNNEHENTVSRLQEWLSDRHWTCYETKGTDILANSDSQSLAVEVKSNDGSNDGDKIREALGQVFENCYRDVVRRGWGDNEVIPCIAFSQAPSDEYSGYIEFLQEEGIAVLWDSKEGVSGHPNSLELLE